MKKFKNSFEKIFIIFLYLQPFLDVSAGILAHYHMDLSISSMVRIIFMILCIVYLIFSVKSKNTYKYLIILLSYFILYTINILYFKGTNTLVYELKNLITTYYFVFVLIALINLYKNAKLNINHLVRIYILYVLLVFIPNILKIGFDSYWHSKEGQVGWFVSANVVGSILSILLPIIIINIKKISIKLVILFILNTYVIFSIGTKTPVLAFILILVANVLYYTMHKIKEHNYKPLIIILILALTLITSSCIIVPKTSFYKNIMTHVNFLQKKDNGSINKEDIIDHLIFSQRLTFEKTTRKAFEKSSVFEKMIGIGYIENYATDDIRLKTVEIDYFDIFYRHGIIGFIIFWMPIIYAMKTIFFNFKYKNSEKLNIVLSIVLIFILALFQGHIFVTPANSIYVALILSLSASNSFIFKKAISK